jgi:hypothetical protein
MLKLSVRSPRDAARAAVSRAILFRGVAATTLALALALLASARSMAEGVGPPQRTPEELHAALKAHNPDYRNKAKFEYRDGRIVSVHITDGSIRSLEPLRGMKLAALECWYSRMADLSPLEGMPLAQLSCKSNQIASLAPLKGAPLWFLDCSRNRIANLSPLEGMPLRQLSCENNQIANLAPLKGAPLKELTCEDNQIASLAALEGAPMSRLVCSRNRITDLSPLKGMPLSFLDCSENPIADLGPLQGLPLRILNCAKTQAANLAPLAGLRLEDLDVTGLPIRDLSILRAMPLRTLALSLDKVQAGIPSFRDHPTLEWIKLGSSARVPVATFWMVWDVQTGRRPRPTIAELAKLDEPWRKKLDEAFADKKISFDFVETPLVDVLCFISSLVDVTFVLDSRAVKAEPKTVTLRVIDLPLREAMARVLKQVGMAQAVFDEAVLITTPEAAKLPPGPPEDIRQRELPPGAEFVAAFLPLAALISFDFVETPLEDVIMFLSSLVDTPIVPDAAWLKGNRKAVTLRVSDMRMGTALRWVCRGVGAAYVWRDGVVFVASPARIREALREDLALYAPQPPPKEFEAAMARPISFDFIETPLEDVVLWLGETAGLPLVLDRGAVKQRPPTLTLRVMGTRCDRALRWIGRQTGTVPVWRGGKILFTTPERAKRP